VLSTLETHHQASQISEVNEYAVKVVPKKRLDQDMVTNIREEVKILACLDHPNIVKFIEEFETQKYLYLVMEYIDGNDLFTEIINS